MDVETQLEQPVKKEKKRKKNDTPKSSKKQKIEEIKEQLLNELEDEQMRIEALNQKQLEKTQSKLNVIELTKEIEHQYEIPDDEKIEIHDLLEELNDYTENLSAEDRKIEEIKEQLLNELEEEKVRIEKLNKDELDKMKSYKKKLDVVEAIKKIEEKYEIERRKLIDKLEKQKAVKIREEIEKAEGGKQKEITHKPKLSKDDKVIQKVKEQLLNELENEEMRNIELNNILKIEHKLNDAGEKNNDEISRIEFDEEEAMEDDDENPIENIKGQLLTELDKDTQIERQYTQIINTDKRKLLKMEREKQIQNIIAKKQLDIERAEKQRKYEYERTLKRKELEMKRARRRRQIEIQLAEVARLKNKNNETENTEEKSDDDEEEDEKEETNTETVQLSEEQMKKIADFDPKKFRQSLLNKQTCYAALKEFNELCSITNANRDFALEYLENGGNTSEIVQIIDITETKSASFALPIMEALQVVCFKIISAHPQKQHESEDSCREFINKHYSLIKAMLALNASSKQRKSALRLLSVIVSLSASTAKEVLSHAAFDQAILDVLYQPSNLTDGSSVRTHFIHFLISFLADGHSAVIIAFLEKRALLTSIFPGLIYDTVDMVHLVLSMIQAKVLEDKAISKTVKMNFFNTQTIQAIVNVFNWKGPRAWNPKKRKQTLVSVNPKKHAQVCEIVQTFLTCLCASKHGIIFFDPSVGLSSKKYNPLLSTVLSGLAKPWTNVYKKELVVRICVACPDMFKSVLANVVEGFLEPRLSDNWFSVIHFVKKLIENLTPSAIEQFLVNLHNKQISIVMQHLCVPHSVLTKITDGLAQKDMQIRCECVVLLNTMLNSAENYLLFIQKNPDLNVDVVKSFLTGYLTRNLPSGSILLKDWYHSIKAARFDSTIDKLQLNVYLTKLLDVLYQYNTFCPGLIENITQDINIKQFLHTIDVLSKKDPTSYDLHIKAINLLISCDITIFAPSKEFFSYAVPLLLKFYYHTDGDIQIVIENMLFALLKLTSIFDCCLDEIMIWLYSILEQPNYDNDLVKFLTKVLIQTNNDFLKYSNEMTNLKEQFTEGYNYRIIIENLSRETKNTLKLDTRSKHRILSPFILGFMDLLLLENNINIKSYLRVSLMNLLHYQTNPTIFVKIVLQEKYDSLIGSKLRKYVTDWKLSKKSPEDTICHKLIHFLTKEDISDMPQLIEYCSEHSKFYTKTLMTNLIMFYFTQKSTTNSLTTDFQTKCYHLLLYIINKSDEKHLNYCLNSILDHPVMLDSYNPVLIKTESSKLSTKLTTDIIKELLKTKTKAELEIYLGAYQTKLVQQICELLGNYSENAILFQIEELMDIIQLFDLSYDNCSEILDILSKIPVSSFKSDKTKSLVVLKLQSFILGHESNETNFKPFKSETLRQVNQQMIQLNNSELNLEELELNLCKYIKQFPHVNVNFDSQLFESLITKQIVSKSSARLAAILLQKNHKYLEIFIKHLDKMYDKRELVFSLTNSIMNVNTEPSIKSLLKNVYKQYALILMKYLNKPQKSANYLVENYHVIIKLVTEQLKPASLKVICVKNHKFDSTEIHHFETLTTIFNKMILGESTEDLKQKYITNYVTTAMNLLINVLKRSTKTEDDWNKSEKVAKHFCTYIIKIKNVYKLELKEEKLYSGAVFQTFAKLCLKFGLQEKPIFVSVLRHLCALTSEQSNIPDLGVLFEMAISHSESLNILLSDDERKAPLLSLLLAICKRCKSVMIKSHIPIWLSAYEATLSETDQCLLQLLSMYEGANIGFHQFRPYLWGKAAVAHYSVRSSIESTLWRQPKPKDVLDLFNENRIVHTVQHFPWTRRLQNDSLYSDSDIEVYDPAFYLPLLSHLLAPESTIRWYQCTHRGIISLPIIALTSENEGIRAAACNVLARFHGHLEAATYAKQRFLWLHLIEAVCRGTSILPSLRPCTIVAVFLARCSIIFSRPDHPLYSTLGNYISAKECPNFNVVPELLCMLHSTDVNHNAHRNFILEVIRDGLCTDEDLKVLYKSVAFKLIMNLYSSVLIDYEGKKIILEILAAAVSLQNGARTLVSSYNIISWLHAVLRQFNKNSVDLLAVFVRIINNLITSFEDDLFKHLQFNILLLLVSVIDAFKTSRLDVMHLVKYIQVLYKVYEKKACVLTRAQLVDLLTMASVHFNCQICNYYLEYGVDYVAEPILVSDDVQTVGSYYLKLLTLKWIQTNKAL